MLYRLGDVKTRQDLREASKVKTFSFFKRLVLPDTKDDQVLPNVYQLVPLHSSPRGTSDTEVFKWAGLSFTYRTVVSSIPMSLENLKAQVLQKKAFTLSFTLRILNDFRLWDL